MQLSVVVPLFNESENLPVLYKRLIVAIEPLQFDFEFIFVNDCSTDNTLDVLKQISAQDKRIRFISFSRNFGNQIALFAGIENAIGEWVCTLDGDLQHPPELIPALLEKAKSTNLKLVLGRRTQRKGEGFLKRIISRQFYRVYKFATGFDMPIDAADFRVMHKSVVMQLLSMDERQKFIRGQLSWLGVNSASVYYEGKERLYGKSGYSVAKLFRFAFDGITAFSNLPLKLATWLGFLVAFFSFLLIIQAFYVRLTTENYQAGWASLMVGILFLGGVQLLSIGIIGEYIGRINENVRKRPLYTIEQTNLETNKQTNA